MDDGSSNLLSIFTSPISVPIIPHAGPISAHFSQKEITFLCRSSRHIKSVSRIARTNSGSVPSFFRKSSSIPFAASSRASNPSFRPIFDKSIIDLIISDGFVEVSLNANEIDLNPLIKSASLKLPSVLLKDPPNVIATDATSINVPNALVPPLSIIP